MDVLDADSAMRELSSERSGHFLLESGHHGELWLDLELLSHQPRRLDPLVTGLAQKLAPFAVDIVCGPLIEGAFVGLMVAAKLDCAFAYSERYAQDSGDALFRAGYRVPRSLRSTLANKRVALVNDVTNAGSAVKATFADLQSCGAQIVAIASLLVLGEAAAQFAKLKRIPLVTLSARPNRIWIPELCPLCAAGVPLEDIEGFASLQSNTEPTRPS